MTQEKSTISELEAILNSEDDRNVTINPDGTITVHPTEVEELRADNERLRATCTERDAEIGRLDADNARLRDQCVDHQQLSFEWMKKHDRLLAFIQEKPELLKELIARAALEPKP